MIEKARVTIPVTNSALDSAVVDMSAIVEKHAQDKGVPVHLATLVRAKSEKLLHVTEFTWQWYVLDSLPPGRQASSGAYMAGAYSIRWENVALWAEVTKSPIHVFGVGSLSIEVAEKWALEVLAATVAAKERTKTDAEPQD